MSETLQERLYRLMAEAGALAPNHTWPEGVLDDYIVGWVQGLQSLAMIAGRTRELEQELERSYQVAADLRAELDTTFTLTKENNMKLWYSEEDQAYIAIFSDEPKLSGISTTPIAALIELVTAYQMVYSTLREQQ